MNKMSKRLCLLLLAVVLILAVCLGLAACKPEETTEQENHVSVYWNVDRESYVAGNADGTSGRYPRSDGVYYIRLAGNGEQKEYPVDSYDLVNRIDLQDCFIPVFDENGYIVDIKTVNEVTGGLVAPALYVSSVEGNKIVANTQGTFLGVNMTLELDEETEVYSIDGDSLLTGLPTTVNVDDEIVAIKDLDGTIGTVFVKPYKPVGDIYWNIHRKYNSTAKVTTRDTDALGYYVFEMALNGEVVTVRTRDYKIANSIDAQAAKCMALTFDDNGDIKTRETTSYAGVKATFGSWYHVVGINGNMVTAERIAAGTDQGNIMEGVMAPDCKIIDVSPVGGYSGAYTELRVGDQIHGLRDARGRIAYIFVHSRLSGDDMPLYWNCERKYSSTTGTTRKPDADGWYYAQVATGGKQITVKTQDKSKMDTLDSYAARCFTMRLKGDNEIDMLGAASAAHAGGTFGSWYYVDAIEGNQLTVSRILSGDTEPTVMTGTMSADIEIINGSTNYKSHCGEYTELQVGDRVHGLTDLRKEIRVLFVVERPVEVPLYWNLTRGYNSTTKETTKKPDADGFYWFTFAVNGEQQTLKTRSKEIANKIDSNAAKCWGLRTWNGEITQVIGTGSVKGYSGGTKSISWVDVISVEGQYAVCQKNQAGHAQDGKKFNVYVGNACKIYDVSNGYTNYAGEPTTLRVGDKIAAYHNGEGIAMLIWIVDGRVKPLNTKPNTCDCATDVVWQPWDGTTELENGGHYYLTNNVVAPEAGFLIENMEVHIRLEGYTISSSGRCFYNTTGGKLNICDHGTRGKLVGNGIANESGGVIRMYTGSGDAQVNLWNIDVVCQEDSTPAKEGGAISCAGLMTLHNVNVSGGVASSRGGNVFVSMYGSFRMFGGSLSNGKAVSSTGGNLNANGVIYLEDVQITGGTATSGQGIYMYDAKYEKRINGITVTGAGNGIVITSGRLDVLGEIDSKLTVNAGASLKDLGLDTASDIQLTMAAEGVVLADTTADKLAVFTNTDTTGDYVLRYDEKQKAVVMDCTIVPQAHTGDHCVCAGADTGLASHSCSTLTGWTAIDDSVFETVSGTFKFKKSGNYYLTVPYDLPSGLSILPDQEITICLNGCRLGGTAQLGRVAGVMNITDCVGTGKTISTANSTNGNNFKVMAGGELNIYGGTHTSTASNTDGGIVVVSQDKGGIAPSDCTEPGVFNFYGGTITGGKATSGGNVILWHTSVFNMYGGTISDGTATNGENLRVSNVNATANLLGGTIKNGDVLITAGTVNLGGSIKIDEFNGNGKTVKISSHGLKAGASIDMYALVAGTLVSNASASDFAKFKFTNIDENIIVKHNATEKTIIAEFESSHKHCICGGVKPTGHSCSTEGWMPLNAETVGSYFNVSSSRYVAGSDELYLYLTEDLDLTYSINLNDGQHIHLCLNGYKLKHTKTSNPVMRVWGDLDITDCSSGRNGSIIGSRTGESPCLYVQNWVTGTQFTTPTVNLFAGTLTADDGNTSSKAGVMQIGNKADSSSDNYATFNMYGGKVCGGDATNGGNLYLETSKAVFNMYDGEVTDGYASGNGGGIYVTGSAIVNIMGGKITGNAKGSGVGADIYTPSNTRMTLGGKITIGEYYSNTIVLTLKNLNAASSIKILRNNDASALFATGADTDVSGCFTNPTLNAVWDSEEKTLSFTDGGSTPEPPPVVESDHKHCICGGVKPSGHSCSEIGYVELTQKDFTNATASSSPVRTVVEGTYTYYALDSGNYYLGENITIVTAINNPVGTTVNLCLNGKTLHGNDAEVFYTKGNLTIADCSATKSGSTYTFGGVVSSSYGGHGPVLYARTESDVTIYGGNFVGAKLDSRATTGGGTMVVGGKLTMYEGVIRDGDASAVKHNGGNMAIVDDGVFNMYGGEVKGGKVAGTQNGGNIRINKGTINMYGGKISGGTAKEGGNIAIGSTGTLNLHGGTISGGEVTDNGGNIALFGYLNIYGGTIKDGVAGVTGGNITTYANKSTIVMTGGIIENGVSPTGANIALRTSGSTKVSLTVTGGQIRGGDGKSVNVANFMAITVTVGGDAKIDCIYLGGVNRRVTISSTKPLTSAASIGIVAAGEQTVVDGTVTTGLSSYNSDYELVVEDDVIKLKAK